MIFLSFETFLGAGFRRDGFTIKYFYTHFKQRFFRFSLSINNDYQYIISSKRKKKKICAAI